jgi:hypothetical protein
MIVLKVLGCIAVIGVCMLLEETVGKKRKAKP